MSVAEIKKTKSNLIAWMSVAEIKKTKSNLIAWIEQLSDSNMLMVLDGLEMQDQIKIGGLSYLNRKSNIFKKE